MINACRAHASRDVALRLCSGGAVLVARSHCQPKIHKIHTDMAIAAGAPLVSLNDGAGARIQEGVSALAGYGGIFQAQHQGVRVIADQRDAGAVRGGAAYSPALTDFVFMVP